MLSGDLRLFYLLWLAAIEEEGIDDDTIEPLSGVGPLTGALEGFAEFWREHGEALAGRIDYAEVSAQLVLMAYLHQIVNGGGFVDREVGIGKKRIDLQIRWPYTTADGRREVQRAA